jgi:hypothetical protein
MPTYDPSPNAIVLKQFRTGSNNYFEETYISGSSVLFHTDTTGSVTGSRFTLEADTGNAYKYVVYQDNAFKVTSIGGGAGTAGTSGAQGAQGASGSGTSGTSGATGTSGTSGAQGDSGTSGTSGAQGATGTSGTSGAQGDSGTSGTSGAQGATGTSGTSGVQGATGTSGTSGVQGATGTSGTSGVQGATGTSGTSGVQGATGTSGTSGVGSAGTSGTSGVGSAGTSGTSGVGSDGTSGTSGAQGAAGTSGVSGTGGAVMVYRTLTTGSANIVITGVGSQTDIDNTSITFTSGNTLTISSVGSLRLNACSVNYAAGVNSTATFNFVYPELNGQTTLANTQMPVLAYYNNAVPSVIQANTQWNVSNASGIVTVQRTGLTGNPSAAWKIIF